MYSKCDTYHYQIYLNSAFMKCVVLLRSSPLHKQYARTVFKNLGVGFHHPTPIQEIWKALTAVFCFTVRPE